MSDPTAPTVQPGRGPAPAWPVLLVDVQATGASPARGHLLEIAWAVPGQPPTATRVALPAGAEIPRPIQRLTGLSAADLVDAPPAAEALAALRQAAAGRVLVAHWARYERGFLGDALPDADWICTYELARRLFPDLPRRGLRAVAGYLGLSLPEHKRAAGHVAATDCIWQALQAPLKARGVTDLAALRALTEAPAPARGKAVYRLPAATRLALPDAPGVYRMLSQSGQVLYVGKATSLKARVNSYFRGKRGQGARKQELAVQVWALDCTECPSPLEAALLEADEIKRHRPPYNHALRVRDRRLWFASGDHQLADAPDASHCLGPVTHPAALDGLRALLPDPPADLRWAERIPADAWAAGLERLRARHPTLDPLTLGAAHWLRAKLTGLEADSTEGDAEADEPPPWTDHPADRPGSAGLGREERGTGGAPAAAEGDAEAADQAPDAGGPAATEPAGTGEPEPAGEPEPVAEPEPENDWPPDRVADRLEAAIAHGQRALRRGRVLTALSHCVVRWQPAGQAGHRQITVTLGQMTASEATDGWPEQTPAPRAARLAALDLAAWDRLVVLAAELRMRLRDGQPVTVRRPGETPLDPETLGALLTWVL